MNISHIEIYSAKSIRAFIEYLKVLADEREAQEEQQKQWNATNAVYGGQIGSLLGAGQATPEYAAKLQAANARANAAADAA